MQVVLIKIIIIKTIRVKWQTSRLGEYAGGLCVSMGEGQDNASGEKRVLHL